MDNILSLHSDLRNRTYRHGSYRHFRISDPKPRDIHKASVLDRLLHHAIYRILYPFFDRTFCSDSFSCRIGKGTHRAIDRFRQFACSASMSHTKTCFVLKCDVRKFFANIDHDILLSILATYICDSDVLWLLHEVVGSFHSTAQGKGLPLGNLTSQLMVNIYMNELDLFVKHTLKARYYIRFADDFLVLNKDREMLESLLPAICNFLFNTLKLSLHPDKVFIKAVASGADFLGWVHFPDHRVLRTATKRRMFKLLGMSSLPATAESYLGLLSHGNARKLEEAILSLTTAK